MATEPRESGCFVCSSAKPVMVTVAGRLTERFLMAAQVWASGFQVHAAASCGVSVGSLLLSDTQRGSISPMRIRSPRDTARMPGKPSPNVMSIRQNLAPAAASRHRKVGAVISGGKTDPFSG